jgi:hypothetical protein
MSLMQTIGLTPLTRPNSLNIIKFQRYLKIMKVKSKSLGKVYWENL